MFERRDPGFSPAAIFEKHGAAQAGNHKARLSRPRERPTPNTTFSDLWPQPVGQNAPAPANVASGPTWTLPETASEIAVI